MILHVATANDWELSENKTTYAPLEYAEGQFIHACQLHQLEGVLHRYFTGRTDLILLYLNEDKLQPKVLMEVSTNNELFPHIYGRINKDAIIKIEPISKAH